MLVKNCQVKKEYIAQNEYQGIQITNLYNQNDTITKNLLLVQDQLTSTKLSYDQLQKEKQSVDDKLLKTINQSNTQHKEDQGLINELKSKQAQLEVKLQEVNNTYLNLVKQNNNLENQKTNLTIEVKYWQNKLNEQIAADLIKTKKLDLKIANLSKDYQKAMDTLNQSQADLNLTKSQLKNALLKQSQDLETINTLKTNQKQNINAYLDVLKTLVNNTFDSYDISTKMFKQLIQDADDSNPIARLDNQSPKAFLEAHLDFSYLESEYNYLKNLKESNDEAFKSNFFDTNGKINQENNQMVLEKVKTFGKKVLDTFNANQEVMKDFVLRLKNQIDDDKQTILTSQNQIEQLNSQVSQLNLTIEANKQTISDLEKQIASLKEQNASKDNQIKQDKQEIEANKQKISDLESQIASLKEQNTLKDQQITKHLETIKEKNSQIEQLTSQKQSQEVQLQTANASLSKAKTKLKELVGSDDENFDYGDKGKNATSGVVYQLWQDINQKDNQIQTKSREIETKQGQIETLNSQVSQKQSQYEQLNTQYQQLDKQFKTKVEELKQLTSQKEALEGQIKQKDLQINTKDQEIQRLQRENEQLRSQSGVSSSQNEQKDRQIKELQSQIEQLQKEKTQLSSQLSQKDQEITQLRQELSEAKNLQNEQINQLTKQKKQLDEQIITYKQQIENLKNLVNVPRLVSAINNNLSVFKAYQKLNRSESSLPKFTDYIDYKISNAISKNISEYKIDISGFMETTNKNLVIDYKSGLDGMSHTLTYDKQDLENLKTSPQTISSDVIKSGEGFVFGFKVENDHNLTYGSKLPIYQFLTNKQYKVITEVKVEDSFLYIREKFEDLPKSTELVDSGISWNISEDMADYVGGRIDHDNPESFRSYLDLVTAASPIKAPAFKITNISLQNKIDDDPYQPPYLDVVGMS